MSILNVIDKDRMTDILKYISFEILDRSLNDDKIVIFSFCSGSADYEKIIHKELRQMSCKDVKWILYDVCYDATVYKHCDAVNSVKVLGDITLCADVLEVEREINRHKTVHGIIGFNIQEAYAIPPQFAVSRSVCSEYLKQQRQEKSLLSLCNALMKSCQSIDIAHFSVYSGEKFNMDFNNFSDFYIDTVENSKSDQ